MNLFKEGAILTFHTSDLLTIGLVCSSKGNQRKWYDVNNKLFIKEQFFYQGTYWNDYMVELQTCNFANQMKFNNVTVVSQKLCKIIDDDSKEETFGVVSKDFRCDNFKDFYYISFKRLLDKEGIDWNESLFPGRNFRFVLEIINRMTGLDYREYLIIMCVLDYLVGNEDRHLNNFGVLYNGTEYQLAPLFDFGLGLFEHDKKYKDKSLEKCLSLMNGKPFHNDLSAILNYIFEQEEYRKIMLQCLPKSFKIDYSLIPSELAKKYLEQSIKITERKIKNA